MRPVVVFGGYGTFGRHVVAHLAGAGIPVIIAGRDLQRAQDLAAMLGPAHRGERIDIRNPSDCRRILEGSHVGVNCAGPFWRLGTEVLDACVDAGCHYVDITDDRAFAARTLDYHTRFQAKRLVAVSGCSSLPGISGALALLCRQCETSQPDMVRVTLFIGNRNPKGAAAVDSFLHGLGEPIARPQGSSRGFCERTIVQLPPPFGRRPVFDFDSPDYDHLPRLLCANAVQVKVGFELRLVTYALAACARMYWKPGPTAARILRWLGKGFGWIGTTGGAVMSELYFPRGTWRRACLLAIEGGQRMAALPCALVVTAICRNEVTSAGFLFPYEALGPGRMLHLLMAEGYQLYVDGQRCAGIGGILSSDSTHFFHGS